MSNCNLIFRNALPILLSLVLCVLPVIPGNCSCSDDLVCCCLINKSKTSEPSCPCCCSTATCGADANDDDQTGDGCNDPCACSAGSSCLTATVSQDLRQTVNIAGFSAPTTVRHYRNQSQSFTCADRDRISHNARRALLGTWLI